MHHNQPCKRLARIDEANGFEGDTFACDSKVTPQGHINWAALISRHYFDATQLVCLKHDSRTSDYGQIETLWKKIDTAWLKWTIVKESFVDI